MDDGMGIVFLYYWETEKNNFSMCSLLLFNVMTVLKLFILLSLIVQSMKEKKKHRQMKIVVAILC